MTPAWSPRRLLAPNDAEIDGLANVLIDCVEGGASVSFMRPLPRERAVAFWRGVAQGVTAGERALLSPKMRRACAAPCNWCSTSPRINRIAPIYRRCWCIAAHAAKGWERRCCGLLKPRARMRQDAAGARHRQRRCRTPVRARRLGACRCGPRLRCCRRAGSAARRCTTATSALSSYQLA
jgi:hypothetical protein